MAASKGPQSYNSQPAYTPLSDSPYFTPVSAPDAGMPGLALGNGSPPSGGGLQAEASSSSSVGKPRSAPQRVPVPPVPVRRGAQGHSILESVNSSGSNAMFPMGGSGNAMALALPGLPIGSTPSAPGSAKGKGELDRNDNIKVVVRVRPMLPHELESPPVLQVTDGSTVKVQSNNPVGSKIERDFAFHACLGPESNQQDVMSRCGVPQLLEAALNGYNVTLFAYGQTGSGKTYTMSGREDIIGDGYRGNGPHDGIIFRSVAHLFAALQRKTDARITLRASYCEIYNERVYDLVNFKKKSLAIKWDAAQGFHVPDLKVVQCHDQTQMVELVNNAMTHRKVGSHELNLESSRSHSIMTVHVNVTPLDPNAWDYGSVRNGKISFVDLAGSERLKDSKSEGSMLKETTNINKSLFVLGKVISCLSDRDVSGTTSHVPYRDSALTKLLMDSLGGSALALMIACCSPSGLHLEESMSTLGYATRAKNIRNRPTVQYDPKEAQIAVMRREIELLRQENSLLREHLTGSASGSRINSVPGSPGALRPSPMFGMPLARPTSESEALLAQRPAVGYQARAPAPLDLPPAPGWSMSPEPSMLAGMGPGARALPALGMSEPEPLRKSRTFNDAPTSVSPRRATLTGADMAQKMRYTESLLSKFSEENSRLARENDKLRSGKHMLSVEKGDLLDEIEMLRGRLGTLEDVVLLNDPQARAHLHSTRSSMAGTPTHPQPHLDAGSRQTSMGYDGSATPLRASGPPSSRQPSSGASYSQDVPQLRPQPPSQPSSQPGSSNGRPGHQVIVLRQSSNVAGGQRSPSPAVAAPAGAPAGVLSLGGGSKNARSRIVGNAAGGAAPAAAAAQEQGTIVVDQDKMAALFGPKA